MSRGLAEPIVFSALEAAAVPMVMEHLNRLDPASRRARFGHAVSDASLALYATRVADDAAMMIGMFHAGVLRGLAELHRLTPHRARDVEFAITIEPEFQDRGMGKALSERAVEAAGAIDVATLHVCFGVDNRRMAGIARHLALQLEHDWPFVVGSRSL